MDAGRLGIPDWSQNLSGTNCVDRQSPVGSGYLKPTWARLNLSPASNWKIFDFSTQIRTSKLCFLLNPLANSRTLPKHFRNLLYPFKNLTLHPLTPIPNLTNFAIFLERIPLQGKQKLNFLSIAHQRPYFINNTKSSWMQTQNQEKLLFIYNKN